VLRYRTEPTNKKWKTEKLKSKKTDMLRSIGKTVRGVSPDEEKNGCGGKDLHYLRWLEYQSISFFTL